MAHNFQDELLEELLLLLEPLALAGQTKAGRRELFRVLGWQLESIPTLSLTALDAAFDAAEIAHTSLSSLTASPPKTLADLKRLLDASAAVVRAVDGLGVLVPPAEAPVGFAELPQEVLGALLVEYLRWRRPRLHALGILLSVIRLETVAPVEGADGFLQRQPVVLERLDLERLVELVKDPGGTLQREYGLTNGLTDPAATADRLFPRLARVLTEFGVLAVYGMVPESGADFGAFADAVAARTLNVLLPLPEAAGVVKGVGVTLSLDSQLGLALAPFGELVFDKQFPRWSLNVSAAVAIPGFAIGSTGVVLPEGVTSFSIAPRLEAIIEPGPDEADLADGTVFKIGSTEATRLELGSFRVEVDAAISNAGHEHGFMISADHAALVVGSGDGDGFLEKMLPAETRLEFDFGIGWSSKSGLRFRGSGGLELQVPGSLDVGPVHVKGLTIALQASAGNDAPSADGLTLEASATVGVDLGPVKATAERFGLSAQFTFPHGGGTLGPVDARLGFKLPSGIGIAVNAGPVTGGGFLSVKDGQYAGALELKIYSVAVKAFGVIETKFPDGSKGFSFVIIISAEFTPIQLGLGFTLLGVGGLVGINRRVDAEALRNAVREGNLENVLFPTNVVVRAPEIIRDLTALFPATEGRYLFGPMARIGWGTPTLIRADLGIILELPGPILSILGEVRCTLPSEDAALIKLNLTVAGQLNFPEKSFELFAALHDSVIAGFAVKGQMAMRLRWGQKPVFALAVGGFHPAFTPPPKFPTLQPMTVDLGRNGNPGITLSGFFAITSNTAQVGGTLALRASGAGVTLEASISVKAIFVFSPFAFEAVIDASVRVSFHGYGIGVRLHGSLSGPSPWRVVGKVCVSVLWWDACLSFQKSFGGGKRVELPTINPFTGTEKALGDPEDIPGLEDAIRDPRSWEPVTPPGVFAVVSLARASDDKPPFDPMGGLSMRQKVVPLETAQVIKRFGVAKAADPRVFSLGTATIGTTTTTTLERTRVLTDHFAPAQFFEMEAHHKLSAPSFEEQIAGYSFTVNADDALAGSVANKVVAYTTRVVDTRPAPPPSQPPRPPGDYTLPETHLVGMLKRSAGGSSGWAGLAICATWFPISRTRSASRLRST